MSAYLNIYLQAYAGIILGGIYAFVDSFIVALNETLGAHFEVLNNALINIKSEPEKEMRENLVQCIRYHQQIFS